MTLRERVSEVLKSALAEAEWRELVLVDGPDNTAAPEPELSSRETEGEERCGFALFFRKAK
jgi:hypothetical protein